MRRFFYYLVSRRWYLFKYVISCVKCLLKRDIIFGLYPYGQVRSEEQYNQRWNKIRASPEVHKIPVELNDQEKLQMLNFLMSSAIKNFDLQLSFLSLLICWLFILFYGQKRQVQNGQKRMALFTVRLDSKLQNKVIAFFPFLPFHCTLRLLAERTQHYDRQHWAASTHDLCCSNTVTVGGYSQRP